MVSSKAKISGTTDMGEIGLFYISSMQTVMLVPKTSVTLTMMEEDTRIKNSQSNVLSVIVVLVQLISIL